MYIGATDFSTAAFYLIMKNYGTSSATILDFSCDSDLSAYAFDQNHIPFTGIIGCTLCPNESLKFPIQLLKITKDTAPISIHITYKSPNKTYSDDFSINLAVQCDILYVRTSTKNQELKTISYALQDIAEKML